MREKRTETICARVPERMAHDLLREAEKEDRKVSDWLYLLIRKELYEVRRLKDTTTS